jgi:predicted aspartyl protease
MTTPTLSPRPAPVRSPASRLRRAVRAFAVVGAASVCAGAAVMQHGGPDLSQGATSFDAALPAEIVVKRAPTGHLLVRPLVNGIDAGWFIFDTGAGICVVSTPHIAGLGLTDAGSIDSVGVGGSQSNALHRAARLTLGPVTLEDHPLMATDLSFLQEHLGEDVAGIIGFGLLTQCVAELDLATPRIALHDRKAFTLAAGSAWTGISLEDRVPTVEASFEGHAGRFRLDTGANSTVTFHEPAVRRWKLVEGREVTDVRLGGVGGFVAAKKGTLASFELGGVRRENLAVEFATEAKGSFAESSRDGNIGARFLEDFVMVLDYGGERLALTPRPAP